MSNSGLVFQVHDPQGAHGFDDEVVEFVGIGTAAGPGDGLAAVDGLSLCIFLDKSIVAYFFDLLRDLVQRGIPGDVFPMIRPGLALVASRPSLVQNILLQRSAFGAERSAIDGMIGIAFHVNYLGVTFFAGRLSVDNHAAAYGAVRTG